MTHKDHVLIDMAESSIKALGVTVCIVSLNEPAESTSAVIQAASPIKRREPLVLDLAPNSVYQAFKSNKVDDFPIEPEIIRDATLLRLVDRNLDLPEPLNSALQAPLIVSQKIVGYLVFGEVRNWERAPFSKEMTERAKAKASNVEDYLERKFSQAS